MKQLHKLNNILTEIIGDILSNDMTLLISQYGFGNIVKCQFCFMEHHIVCYPTKKLLTSSQSIYQSVVLAQYKPIPIWFCKTLYYHDIKYPILSCSTYNQLVKCQYYCDYASVFDRIGYGYCDNCQYSEISPCDNCNKYPKYNKLLHQYHDNNLECCSNYDCGRLVCNDCITDHGCKKCVKYCSNCCDELYDRNWSCNRCGNLLCGHRDCYIHCQVCERVVFWMRYRVF